MTFQYNNEGILLFNGIYIKETCTRNHMVECNRSVSHRTLLDGLSVLNMATERRLLVHFRIRHHKAKAKFRNISKKYPKSPWK